VALSARLSQVRYTWEDASYGMEVFPEGKLDADLQQVDLRTMNSWRMTLDEVSTPELLEVQLVNAIAPFVLAGRLRELMKKSGGEHAKHVVNVSAMEGSFSRGTKTDKHPHTNMAKAALNMMTLTSAPDYARDGIFMNAVDTGWVTDEDPAQHATRKKEDLGFQPPLDIVDGAARVIDPIFSTANGAEPTFGKFLKDYKPTSW
jgi:NAD(P)-dependent dehydrogenase (short-subunit alcohol dehydrogenase family)